MVLPVQAGEAVSERWWVEFAGCFTKRCSPAYLDGKFAVAQQSSRVQLTPAAGWENQRVPAVAVPAERPVHQLPDGVNLTEAGALQHMLDLSGTGNRERERGRRRRRVCNRRL